MTAILRKFNSIIRGGDGDEIAHRVFQIARLHYVPTDEGALREAHDIELLFPKHRMPLDLITRLTGLLINGRKHGADIALANLYALGVPAGALAYFPLLLRELVLLAVLHDPVEDHCRHGRVFVWAHAVFGDEELGFILFKLPDKCAIILLVNISLIRRQVEVRLCQGIIIA